MIILVFKEAWKIKFNAKFIIPLILIVLLSGCSKKQIINYDWDQFESVAVWKYDYSNSNSTEKWVYTEKDTEEILNYLKTLKGIKEEGPQIDESVNLAYGIDLMGKDSLKITLIDDYAVISDGQYYKIDCDQIANIYETLNSDERTFDFIMMMNHRYISLINGEWDKTYMMKSTFSEPNLKNVYWKSDSLSVSQKTEIINSTITNKSDKVLEYGEEESLEVLIDNEWYSINSMTNNGLEICWNSILNILDPNKQYERSFYLEYYQHLPKGEYRLAKAVDEVNGNTGVIYLTFKIE